MVHEGKKVDALVSIKKEVETGQPQVFSCHLCKKNGDEKPWKFTQSSLQKHIDMDHKKKTNEAVVKNKVRGKKRY